jgi:mannosyltransferase OCH1-like enzyme
MSGSLVTSVLGNVMNSDIMKGIQQQKIKDKRMAIELKIKVKVPYPVKENYYPVIPLNIYQTWHTKDLPPLMKNTVNKIIYSNPGFNYQLFDDNDCRNFIKDNFDANVLNAFDSLIPGAYKADLWRYCILYKNGGVYLDIKYAPFNGFRFISLMEKEHWVLDMDKNGIYNALIVCKPNNEILLKAINKVVANVKNKFYGNSPLEPTGPLMLSQFFTQNDKKIFDMYHDIYQSVENRFIFLNGYLVLKSYNSYLNEHNKNKKVDYYGSLWVSRNIYK